MKLRCTTNSIRIRIRKSELDVLAKKQIIEDHVQFGHSKAFSFGLSIQSDAEQVGAWFKEGYLGVVLPLKTAQNWINSNEVRIEVNNVISDQEQLHILVEKDFPCTDRENEDKSDTFWELVPDTPDAC